MKNSQSGTLTKGITAALIEGITKSLALIESPDNWLQHDAARDRNGHLTSPDSLFACKFCLVGSLQRSFKSHYFYNRARLAVLDTILEDCSKSDAEIYKTHGIHQFNDRKTHEEVKLVLNRTLERLKS